MKSKEPSQDIDDILIDEESADFDADDIDNDLFDGKDLLSVDNSSDINNIFPFQHNLHEKLNKIVLKQPIHGFREVSLSFSLFNINRILKTTNIAYKDVSSILAKYGKSKPIYSNEEVERIVSGYIKNVPQGNDDVVVATSFINMWKEGTVNDVISYYFIKANSRNKINASTVGVENIV